MNEKLADERELGRITLLVRISAGATPATAER